MSSLEESFGLRLQALRTAKGLTQEELAREVDAEPKFIADLERARRRPSFEMLARLADALEVEARTLFDFGPKGKSLRREPDEEALVALARSLKGPERRLVLALARTFLRWRAGEKK